MKRHISTGMGIIVMVSALLACNATRADILTVTNGSVVSSWDAVGGNAPFYATTLTGLSSQGFPSSTADPYIVLSETFTITNNGAGGLTATAAGSNWVLNAISMIAAGGNGPVQIHLFDVTTNLTSNNGTTLNGSGATYNFVANGDLLGNGNGLVFTNNLAAESQEVIVLQDGPNSVDQVVLGTNHTYALEFWVPKASSGNLFWYRNAVADPGGEAMGSHAGSLAVGRLSIASLGLAGAAPRTFAVALYGSPTTSSFSANSNTNFTSSSTNYIVDDFSTNGVGPGNPINYDYFNVATQEVYIIGDITNVWGTWFGNAFDGVSWSPNDAQGNPASGSMEIQLGFGTNNQFVVHHANYANIPNISSEVYTDLAVDVEWAAGSAVGTNGTFGPLRFGVRPNAVYNVQDWFFTTNIVASDTNWVHLDIPLSTTDPNLSTGFGELLIGMDSTGTGLNGPSTLYVDNIKFVGPLVTPVVLPPTLAILPAKPGLRMFAGSTAHTYDRATISTSTANENESWIGGGGGPVTYSFSLLSYPNNNINQTMVEILPIGPLTSSGNTYLGGTFPGAGNEYADYQDPNGMWLVLAPNGGGAVTATVEWKTNAPNANPGQIALTFTNPTAIGTWTWTFNNANSGTVTAPGGAVWPFTITDATVTADFANPCGAVFGLQPNSTTGEGTWEDWGLTAISGTAGINVTDVWTQQTSDFSGGNSPDNDFSAQGSANPPEIIVTVPTDAYWISWTTPAPVAGFGVVVTTNILSGAPSTWIDPPWYSGNSDFTPPRANASVLLGPKFWTVMPYDDLPTVDGNAQPSPPAIKDPLAPNAYFIGTTNYNAQYP